MEQLINKYSTKIIDAGLALDPLVCGLDDEIIWNRSAKITSILEAVMAEMNINSLICAEPAEPYHTILRYLTARYPDTITPSDCETRTFLHDLPVINSFSAEKILARILKRKSVIVAEKEKIHIITFGTVSPEQAFVTLSSVCFASFVLFFSDYLQDLRQSKLTSSQEEAFRQAISFLKPPKNEIPTMHSGPFKSESDVYEAIIEAGRHTVEYGLVDSYFGNISYRMDETIFISQTGSSLDELSGCIDPCPMDGSSTAGVTASSELVAHSEIFLRSDNRAILHGHPKFTVILSMDCQLQDCPNLGQCHIKCSQPRSIQGIPIVPGEVGTGPTGLCNTLPPAIQSKNSAIVWGHGLFTVSALDFIDAFKHLLETENMCRQEYFRRVEETSQIKTA